MRIIDRHIRGYGLELRCETVAGGMRERNWRKGKDAEDPKTHDLRAPLALTELDQSLYAKYPIQIM